jgi:SAM-dependent methyltransferase
MAEQTSGAGFAYTGCDNLEVMQEAVNYNRFLLDCVMAEVDSPTATVLDFGAGRGTYADLLTERGLRPDCLEPDPTLQERLARNGYHVVDDSSATPSYDVIYSLNVLEHIKNDQEALEQLAGWLRPGGRLVLYVPALELLYTSMDKKVGHFRRYRRAQLCRLVGNAGLRVESATYCDPVGVLATLAYKYLGRSDGTISSVGLKIYDRLVFPLSRSLQVVTGRLFGKNLLLVAVRR